MSLQSSWDPSKNTWDYRVSVQPLEVEYSQALHATETGIRSGLMGHLALTQTLPTPPYVFTKLLRPFEKHLRLQGICTTIFLDDG